MQQATYLQQPKKFDLLQEMDAVIATQPEWRFLEQQRHLKDVIRLLLRDTQSHAHLFNHDLFGTKNVREQALTSSWLSLLMSQELQHPPQLTRQSFSYTFYLTLAGDQCASSTQAILENALTNHFSTEGFKKLHTLHQLCLEISRLHREHICTDKPWHSIQPYLFFLNHIAPSRWISAASELMLLLKQHNSLLSVREDHLGATPSSKSQVNPQELHKSHPLRKNAAQKLQNSTIHYTKLNQIIHSNRAELTQFLQNKCNTMSDAHTIESAMTYMTDAWAKACLLKAHKKCSIHYLNTLFAEAQHQRLSLTHTLIPTLKSLRFSASTVRQKELCEIIETIFEV